MVGCRLPLRPKAWTTTLLVVYMTLVCAASQKVDACPANSAHKKVIPEAIGSFVGIGTQSINMDDVADYAKTAFFTALLALLFLWHLLCIFHPSFTPNPIDFSGTSFSSVKPTWDPFVECLMAELRHGGNLTSAAIIGQDGGIWAQSKGFPEVNPAQVAAIMKGFECYEKCGHPGDELGNAGLCLGDQKFLVANGDASIMRGRPKSMWPFGPGCTIKRTETALVIGIYEEVTGHLPVDADIAVENMGDYIIKSHI